MKIPINRRVVVRLRIEAADKIKQYRLDESLSIMEMVNRLADNKCRISRQSIHDWESGKSIPTFRMIQKIGNALEREFI